MTGNNSLRCSQLDAIEDACSLLCRVKDILTCCFDETDALLDEDWDWSLRCDHGGQRHAKVVAFDGFGDGMPGFGSGFLEKQQMRRKISFVGTLRAKSQHYLSLIDTDTADMGKHFQIDTEPRGIVLRMT